MNSNTEFFSYKKHVKIKIALQKFTIQLNIWSEIQQPAGNTVRKWLLKYNKGRVYFFKWIKPILDTALGQLAALEQLSYRLLDKVEEYNLKWGKYHSYTLDI